MQSLEQESVNYRRLAKRQFGGSQVKMAFVRMGCVFTPAGHPTAICSFSAQAASDLRLAPNLSFNDDSSANFPIRGRNSPDGAGLTGKGTIIFFGTSNCWNTAREAERLVKLYPQFRNRFHFVVVDLRNVSPGQQPLVSSYYHGYIPTITAICSDGKVIYSQAGVTATNRGDTTNLQHLLDSLH